MASASPHGPRWFWVPLRVLLFTLLLTLLAFAISLFLGIVGLLLWAAVHHSHPNMAFVYRRFAPPIAGVVGAATLVTSALTEFRRYQQSKVLAAIERAGQSG